MFLESLLTLVCLLCVSIARDLPTRIVSGYLLLADDTITGYTSNDTWQPSLFDYQQNGCNVLFFAFLNPKTMIVPKAFSSLSKCKGQSDCPTNDQYIIYSIGGYGYSTSVSYWPWLQTSQDALSMAAQVSTWDVLYNMDGIDIDLEDAASQSSTISENLLIFVKQLKTLNPNIIITIPTYGYPQLLVIDNLINHVFDPHNATYYNLAATVSLMVYANLTSLEYVENYANSTNRGLGNVITVNVPRDAILAGIQGTADNKTIIEMANAIVEMNIRGMMFWFASVYDKTRDTNAFTYYGTDASFNKLQSWNTALNILLSSTATTTTSTTTTTTTTTTSTSTSTTTTTSKAPTSNPTKISTSTTTTFSPTISTTATIFFLLLLLL